MTLPRLYAIVDVDVCARAGRQPLDVTRAFLAGGARLLQLRAKTTGSGAFLDLACGICDAARETQAMVIVNDRADIAAISGAAGVHVGQDDLGPEQARRVVGAGAVVGLSTHSDAQLSSAVTQPVSYVAVGPVFGTGTKDTGYEPIGLGAVRRAAAIAQRAGVPLVAIGGITLEQAASVIDSGADSIAVISDLLIGDPEVRVRAFVGALR